MINMLAWQAGWGNATTNHSVKLFPAASVPFFKTYNVINIVRTALLLYNTHTMLSSSLPSCSPPPLHALLLSPPPPLMLASSSSPPSLPPYLALAGLFAGCCFVCNTPAPVSPNQESCTAADHIAARTQRRLLGSRDRVVV